EVFDAELYWIMKATEIAVKLTNHENITDVWIFCDNQSAVRRMSDKRALPGKEVLFFFYFIHTAGKPKAYGIIKENPATAQNKKNKRNPPHGRVPTTNTPFLQSTAI